MQSSLNMDARTVLVFGASGLLGSSLCPLLARQGFRVLRQGRSVDAEVCCDPCSETDVRNAMRATQPKIVINLVAESNVDRCETEPARAFAGNVVAARLIAGATLACGSRPHLIHVSSDHVYSGPGPHREEQVDPVNVYALTKLTGEIFALDAGATVLRTNFHGRSRCTGRPSFTDWLSYSLGDSAPFTVFEDVRFSALHLETLATLIGETAVKRNPGLYNLGTTDSISKASFAARFAELLGLDTTHMRSGRVADHRLPAKRPTDMSMDVSRFETAFGIPLPTAVNELARAAADYRRP